MDDKGQMMVLETVFFAVTVLLALIFLYQLAPSSAVSNEYTNILKVQGDDALQSLYTDVVPGDYPSDFPSNKLVYYLITNDYDGFTLSNLNNLLPSTVMYNIYISNGTKTVFWCNSDGNSTAPLQTIGPVTTSHIIIAMHPKYLTDIPIQLIGEESILNTEFSEYDGSTYDIVLEMLIL